MGQKLSNTGSALSDAVQDAKVALKSARRGAKLAKARLRALKGELKVARKQRKQAREQLQAAKQALDQARAAAVDQGAESGAPKKPTRKRVPALKRALAQSGARARAIPPLRPVAPVALSRPFSPVKLQHGAPTHAARSPMPILPLPSSAPAATPDNHAATAVPPGGVAR